MGLPLLLEPTKRRNETVAEPDHTVVPDALEYVPWITWMHRGPHLDPFD
jgi:hypothetical protein